MMVHHGFVPTHAVRHGEGQGAVLFAKQLCPIAVHMASSIAMNAGQMLSANTERNTSVS
jgi:hypothetical protein